MLIGINELRDAFCVLELDYRSRPDSFRRSIIGEAGELNADIAAACWTDYILSQISAKFTGKNER